MLTTVKPVTLLLTLAWSSGAPLFDAVRPKALDLPLRGFHEDVSLAASEGFTAIRQLAATGSVRGTVEAIPGAKLFRQVDRDVKAAIPSP
jgi:hypothetical protein